MAGIYRFKTSRLSHWALWLSRLSIPVAILSFLLLRFGGMHPSVAIYCFAAAAALALLSMLVSFAAFPSIWVEGYIGGRRLWVTFVRSLFLLIPALLVGYLYISLPRLSDVTTAPLDPPEFNASLGELHDEDNSLSVPSLLEREQQALAYPELKSLAFQQQPALLYLMVEDAMKEQNWEITRARPVTSDWLEDSYLEASIRSIITGLRYAVVVRLRDDGDEGTIVDMRSASLWGPHDLGLNSRRVLGFQETLKSMVADKIKLYEIKLEEQERQRRLKQGPLPRPKPKRSARS